MPNKTEKKPRGRSILATLFRPLAVLLLALILLMGGVLFYGGIIGRLDQNALDILGERVKNRKSYLETEMVGKWSALDLTVSRINSEVEALRAAGQIDLNAVDTDKTTYMSILDGTSDDLISLMRSASVTGAYVVLSSGPIDPDTPRDKKGLYLRDLDPTASASLDNTDLLIKRGPFDLTEKLGITTDSDWRTQFAFSEAGEYVSFFAGPYQAALDHPDLSWSDLGCWSESYHLLDDSRSGISYSVPLRLEDGTLYGVLGVELTLDYLSKQLPARELLEGTGGSYLLAVTEDGTHFRPVLSNGLLYTLDNEVTLHAYQNSQTVYTLDGEQKDRLGAVEYLSLYNTNTPFAGSRWALIGVADRNDLFRFSRSVQRTVVVLSVLLFGIGLAVVSMLSFAISRPIAAMSHELGQADRSRPIRLRRTYIQEIDHMAGEIEMLSEDVFSASMKFANILQMASIRIGGFEMNSKNHSLFITDGFFDICRLQDVEPHGLTDKDFCAAMERLRPFVERHSEIAPGEEEIGLFFPAEGNATLSYVRLRCIRQDGRIIGLAEDVTDATLERQKVERERDHDLLTGLLSRRAFQQRMEWLLEQDAVGTGVLLMLDLDNLKHINDTYGHDYGDKYICALADVLQRTAPEGHSLLCRQSGDEMFAFYYGYDGEPPVQSLLQVVRHTLLVQRIPLPNGGSFPVSASSGAAWYPRDSTDLSELIRYADFAMYEVKRSSKGGMRDFSLDAYHSASHLQKCKEEFSNLLAEERVVYHWQPIVSAKTGEAYAYEALMRTDLETLRDPQEVLDIAAREARLDDIERITLFHAMASFAEHCEAGRFPPDCRAFINSIPNQLLSYEDSIRFEQRFAGYLSRLVVEITENDRVRENILKEKREWNRRWNAAFALDDYGSGYNSELMLLSLAPEYVKIDMSITRDIDRDRDKQQLVRNMVVYAAERDIRVIAEGVETRSELEAVVHLGVDFVQGYYIARPARIPPAVPDEVRETIRRLADA